jgi:hypothetical protein
VEHSKHQGGIFVISLDFELHWGVTETKTVSDYKENLDNTREAIRAILQLFGEYDIHVTWASVGFLFCKDKKDILERTKNIEQPLYDKKKLSNYNLLAEIGNDYKDDPYHYGNDMISLIKSQSNQEIGTHSFSHYYCLESGASSKSFSDDLELAIAVAENEGIVLRSIVFPRNQYSHHHLQTCQAKKIFIYRGNSNHWLYKPLPSKDQHVVRRLGRLIDSYINLSGTNTYKQSFDNSNMVNIPGSRFLRPYHPKFSFFEFLRLNRIKQEMSHAAKHQKIYHLWWHPHNFGKHLNENIKFLKKILDHFKFLKESYSFASLNMHETAERLKHNS